MCRTFAVAAVMAASLAFINRADAQVVIPAGGTVWPSGVYWNNPGIVYPAGYTSNYFPAYTANPSISFGGVDGVALSSGFINPNLGATNHYFYNTYPVSTYYNPYYGRTVYSPRGIRGRGWRW